MTSLIKEIQSPQQLLDLVMKHKMHRLLAMPSKVHNYKSTNNRADDLLTQKKIEYINLMSVYQQQFASFTKFIALNPEHVSQLKLKSIFQNISTTKKP